MQRSKWFAVPLLAVPTLFAPTERLAAAAPGPEAQGQVLAEVVVTARRREESLQDAPVTVSAIGRATIDDFRLQSAQGMVELAPNAIVPENSFHENTQIAIRGGRFVDPQVEPDFGLYRNGQYYGGPRTNLGSLVDVERMEVLRGPQVALYGRNAMNGAVNIVFATPTDKLGGYLSATGARYERGEFQGWVNAPVNDQFAVRLAGWYFNQSKGEHYNITLNKELDKQDDKGARLSARWRPSQDVEVLWMVEKGKESGPESTEFIETARTQWLGLPWPSWTVFGVPPLAAETKGTIQRNTLNRQNADTTYASQDINWNTAAGTLSVLANYRKYDYDSTRDLEETPFSPDAFPTATQQLFNSTQGAKDYNLEARWVSKPNQPVSWMLGASYLDEKLTVDRSIPTTLNLTLLGAIGIPVPPVGDATAAGATNTSITTKSWSAYTEFTFKATDRLDLTVGGRYTSDQKTLDFHQFISTDGTLGSTVLSYLFCPPPQTVGTPGCTFPKYDLATSKTFTNFSPHGQASFKFTDRIMGYVLVSKGFRAGSYNITTTDPALIPYGAETGINYEIGLKTTLADNRVRFNVAAFQFDIKNVLLRVLDPVNSLFSSLQNAGDARTRGLEAELMARPVAGLDIGMSAGWLDPKVTHGQVSDQGQATPTNISGSQIPGTRTFTGALIANYSWPVFADFRWFVNGNLRVQTGGNNLYEHPNTPGKWDPLPQPDFTFLNLSTGFDNAQWRVVLYADNVADKQPITSLRPNAPGFEIDRAQGRTYGIRVSRTW
jgi:iron complex outermembrane recepter protein